MDLVAPPQIWLALMAGLLIGGGLLVLLVLSDGRAGMKPAGKSGLRDAAVIFLFTGRSIVQATDNALMLLGKRPDGPGESGPDDWENLQEFLIPRFDGFPDDPARSDASGRIVLHAREASDPARLVLDWWDGQTRVTLIEPEMIKAEIPAGPPDIAAIPGAADLEAEAAWLRQAVTGAPYPIWQSGDDGQVLWANTAYRSLVTQFSGEPPPDTACPALFDIPVLKEPDQATYRMSVSPQGSVQPYWFDIRSLRLETGCMNYATDVNAVVNAEIAQRNFVQTLTKTFAQLSIGLAIFDRKRQLALFNPALIDLTSLPAEFLSARPNLLSFFDRLRDRQMMPEPKNYRSWRDQIADLVAAADTGQYRETWSLPSGLTYRISGRPHPDGAVAFLFEDISAEISLTRRFRSQLELGQAVLNAMDHAIAVFSPSGILAFSNTAYRKLWGIDPDSSFADITVTDASRHWQEGSRPTPVWGDLRDFVVQFGERAEWQTGVTLRDGSRVTCQAIPMAGGATLVMFQQDGPDPLPVPGALLHDRA